MVEEPQPFLGEGQGGDLVGRRGSQGFDSGGLRFGTRLQLERQLGHRRGIEDRLQRHLDTELVLRAARECGAILTVEEHQVNGGLGSAVAEVVVQNHPVPMRLHGMHGEFGQSATAGELLAHYRLDAAGIAAEAKDLMGRKG